MTRKQIIALIVALLVLSAGAIWCFWVKRYRIFPHMQEDISTGKQAEVYVCPMHPNYSSDKPGNCPICGMKLIDKTPEPDKEDHSKYKDHQKEDKFAVEIDVNKQQLIGIATTQVKQQAITKEIKALGTVTPDERLINHVHTKFSGYIEKVFADYEGKYISKGSPLFTIYSPELVSTQEEYLLALKAEKELSNSNYDLIDKSHKSLKEASLRRLKLWDISDEEIKNLEANKEVKKDLTIYASYGGFITKRIAYEGLTIDPSKTLYEITDLSRVWVIAEVYEDDLAHIAVGQKVFVKFPYDNAKAFQGTLTYIYPDLDPTNRTAKVRVEVYNKGYELKPNMYVDAYISKDLGTQTIVPKSAVIDTGEKKIVFVKKGEGSFVPTGVELGPEFDLEQERYQVINSGLSTDDFVVTDGNFLLDSESNLQSALKQMVGGHQH